VNFRIQRLCLRPLDFLCAKVTKCVSAICCGNLLTYFIYLIRVYSLNCIILDLKQVIKGMGCVSNVEKDWILGFRVVSRLLNVIWLEWNEGGES